MEEEEKIIQIVYSPANETEDGAFMALTNMGRIFSYHKTWNAEQQTIDRIPKWHEIELPDFGS